MSSPEFLGAADSAPPPVTRILAEFVSGHSSGAWDDTVEHAAHRTVLNWLGCAIGAAHHPTVQAALAALRELEPSPQATVLGRSDRLDVAGAAMVNGISSHVFDFDDTHLGNLVHPAGPVVSAVLALAERHGGSGRELLDAVVIGIDVSCRVANMIYPDHYRRGWHITGSAGVIGAAAASARLLRLDAERTAMTLGLAASQPVGLREQFGTMAKPFHPGAAARAGLMSVLFARHGFVASTRALEAPRGFACVVSTRQDWNAAVSGLGERFEIALNTFKPFACGVVIHPSIDGCLTLRSEHGLRPDDIERVEIKVHPIVLELTGKVLPLSGLEGKFSVYHACAAALTFGAAGEAEFRDDIVRRPDVVALRSRIVAVVDESVDEEEAEVVITCSDGRQLRHRVQHALGSLARPMKDSDLDAKFDRLVVPVLGAAKAEKLREICWTLASAGSVAELLKNSCP